MVESAWEFQDDALERGPGADDEAEDSEEDHDGVLDDHADALGVGHVVPVGAGLDDGGEGQPERGEAERAEEGDEQVQLGYGCGYSNCGAKRIVMILWKPLEI